MQKFSICVLSLLVLLAVFQAFAADPKSGVLRASGDNTWEAYVHGKEVGRGADWQQVGVYDFEFVKGSATIAIYVHDAEAGGTGSGGFLADIVLDNGDYIGTGITEGWKASSDAQYMKHRDWTQPEFNDEDWEEPTVYDPFGGGIWGFGAGAMRAFLKDPDCTACWIWAGPNNVNDDVFFRYTIGKVLAVESHAKSATTWGHIKLTY